MLFAVYTDDLAMITKLCFLLFPTLFADDIVLPISGNNGTQLQNILNMELVKVDQWLR